MTKKNYMWIMLQIKQYWKPITIVLLMSILVLSLYPLEKLPELEGNDKTNHLFAYFLLAFPSGLKEPRRFVFFILVFVIFGGVIEIIQPFLNRSGEWFDFLANCIGTILGFSVGAALSSLLLKFNY